MTEENSRAVLHKEEKDKLSKEITFHYIKGNLFRVICVNGVWGGPTPNAEIHISVFNERAPIPQQMTFGIKESGELDKELGRVSRQGIIREVEAELVMNISAAEAFHGWLGDKIKAARAIQADILKRKQGK